MPALEFRLAEILAVLLDEVSEWCVGKLLFACTNRDIFCLEVSIAGSSAVPGVIEVELS